MHEERFITWTPYGKRKQIYEGILNSLVLFQHRLLSHACVSIHMGPGTQSTEESIRKWCDHDYSFGGSWISTWSKCKTTSFPARNVPRTLSPDPVLTDMVSEHERLCLLYLPKMTSTGCYLLWGGGGLSVFYQIIICVKYSYESFHQRIS